MSSVNTVSRSSVEKNSPGTTGDDGPPDTAKATSVNGNDPLVPDDTPNGSDMSTVSASNGKPKEKKKKRFHLTSLYVLDFEKMVQMNLSKHKLASRYFLCRQYWFFTVSQGLLTMIVSILGFTAATTLPSDMGKVRLNLAVGSFGAVVVFLQTMSGICEYGTRAAMHGGLAIDLRDLLDATILLKSKLGMNEISNTINPACKEDYQDYGDDFEAIESRFRQSLSGCKSNVPLKLSEAFHSIKSEMAMMSSKANLKRWNDVYGLEGEAAIQFLMMMESKLDDILAAEILDYNYFPILLPNAKEVTKKSINRWRTVMTTSHTFFVDGSNDVEAGYG